MPKLTMRVSRLFLAIMAGLAGAAVPASAQAPKLVVAHPSDSLAVLPFYVARDKKFFDKAGVSIDLMTVGASNFYPALFSGEVDAVQGNISQPMTLRERGQTVTTVGTVGVNFETQFAISRKLADSAGITFKTPLAAKLKILKGKTIAVTGQGAGTDAELRFLLAKAGLDYQKDVIVTYIKEGSADVAALANGQIDGFIHDAPWYQIAIARGNAVMFVNFGAGDVPEANGYLQSVIDTTPKVIAAKRPALVRMMAGLTMAMRYIHQPQNLADVVAIAQKDVSGGKNIPGMNSADIQAYVKYLIATDQIPASPAVTEKNFIVSRDFGNAVRKIQNQPQLNYSYTDMVDPAIAAEGIKAADGQGPRGANP